MAEGRVGRYKSGNAGGVAKPRALYAPRPLTIHSITYVSKEAYGPQEDQHLEFGHSLEQFADA
jgi:hypothetical protein